MFRIVNDKSEAERIVRDGGKVLYGKEACLATEFIRPYIPDSIWSTWTGPYVVVREPEPKPLTDEEIAAELEKIARNCYGSAYYEGMGRGYLNAAKIVRERKL